MPLTRLLLVAVLALPLPVFAQNRQSNSILDKTQAPRASMELRVSAEHMIVSSESANLQWQLAPGQKRFDAADNSITIGRFQVDQGMNSLSSDGRLVLDTTCFAIRSYVVARDSKDSDSTHLVHYSTCQPASRYRLRTTQIHTEEASR